MASSKPIVQQFDPAQLVGPMANGQILMTHAGFLQMIMYRIMHRFPLHNVDYTFMSYSTDNPGYVWVKFI